MSDEKILKKAIKKAEKNGWKGKLPPIDDVELLLQATESVIFDHSFAKSFFGEEIVKKDNGNSFTIEGIENEEYQHGIVEYLYHLQQMVLCENPLKYIETFL